MALSSTQRTRAVTLILASWLGLVACRVAARLVSVGAGSRGVVGLALLTASVNSFWLLAAPAVAWTRWRMSRSPKRLLGILLVASVVASAVVLEPLWYRLVLSTFHGTPMMWRDAVVARADVNILIALIAVAASSLGDVYRRALAGQRQHDEVESSLVDSEVRSLTLQLQPHFLFNTLQLAAEAAYDDITAAKRIVTDLEILLKRTFAFEESSLVRVADEVDFLQAYVAIQRSRFGSRLSVAIRVEPNVANALMPPMLLQPLVENSIRHGLGPLARDGRILVRITEEDERLCLEVRDNGVGFSIDTAPSGDGLGLGVTRRRLLALYNDQHSIELGVAPEGGALVRIILPLRQHRDDIAEPVIEPVAVSHSSAVARQAISLIGGITAVVVLNVAVAEVLLRRGSVVRPPSGGLPAAVAMWLPAQVLVLAGVVLLTRGRRIRTWLHERDTETRVLRARMAATRARVAALRAGTDLMLTALNRLTSARSPSEFDRLVVSTSGLIRSLLLMAEDGESSVELEADLVGRYVDVIGRHARTASSSPLDVDISVDATHCRLPSGTLPALVNALLSESRRSDSAVRLSAKVVRGWLEVAVETSGETPEPVDAFVTSRHLSAIENRVRHAGHVECEVHFQRLQRRRVASLRLRAAAL